jgi:hypothetical protein
MKHGSSIRSQSLSPSRSCRTPIFSSDCSFAASAASARAAASVSGDARFLVALGLLFLRLLFVASSSASMAGSKASAVSQVTASASEAAASGNTG